MFLSRSGGEKDPKQQARSEKKRTKLSEQQGRTIILKRSTMNPYKKQVRRNFSKEEAAGAQGKTVKACATALWEERKPEDPPQHHGKVLCSMREKESSKPGSTWK